MAVGNQPSVSQVNQNMTNLSQQLRNLMTQIKQQWQYLNAIGAGELENLGGTGLGFSAPDAAAVLQLIDYMYTLSGCYFGTVQQGGSGGTGAIQFDFDQALCQLWGGE